jgi:hypothetical protein
MEEHLDALLNHLPHTKLLLPIDAGRPTSSGSDRGKSL